MILSKASIGLFVTAAAIAIVSNATLAQQPPGPKKAAPAAKHVLLAPGDLKWGPAPDALPAGAQLAVLDGDPSKPGTPFAVQLKFPAGYRIAPHWHPTDENIVVLAGTFMMGMGDKMDEASMTALAVGGYGKMPRQMHHYAMAKSETTIQLYGMGPFLITYVNPSDDPRKKSMNAK